MLRIALRRKLGEDGDDCELCKSPWIMPQRKNWP
jgi:hypothetical protein